MGIPSILKKYRGKTWSENVKGNSKGNFCGETFSHSWNPLQKTKTSGKRFLGVPPLYTGGKT